MKATLFSTHVPGRGRLDDCCVRAVCAQLCLKLFDAGVDGIRALLRIEARCSVAGGLLDNEGGGAQHNIDSA